MVLVGMPLMMMMMMIVGQLENVWPRSEDSVSP